MKSTAPRTTMMVSAILLSLVLTASATQAGPVFSCHGIKKPNCRGVFTLFSSDVSFSLDGTPALAEVEEFTDPAKTRNVYWKDVKMEGTTANGGTLTATLDPNSESSGTVLSVGTTEFPATATMRFFFKMETQGMTMVSKEPAVFQGIIHSIPPADGDVLTLISGPVSFHKDGDPTFVIGALKESQVTFGDKTATLLFKKGASWSVIGLGALLISGGLYKRRRTVGPSLQEPAFEPLAEGNRA